MIAELTRTPLSGVVTTHLTSGLLLGFLDVAWCGPAKPPLPSLYPEALAEILTYLDPSKGFRKASNLLGLFKPIRRKKKI
jgi:hypothetical protein